ncbi:MAG: helix-turn-helix domain-containing protein [Gammaproteobacteria bacterium]|nr:helix-turn-helix domain-containing protein [Gammaproteobacteria bacterium]MDJ0891106.1 helix-turn-helix domain-containing protein [Gammaproteobacteria bacterium]
MYRLLIFLVTLGVRALRPILRSREELVIENLALRQQVSVMKKKRPRPVLDDVERALWPGWSSRLVIVTPDTVAEWHRDRFRRYGVKIFEHRNRPGRPRIDPDVGRLIRTMARDGWGAPRIHGELVKLGFAVS